MATIGALLIKIMAEGDQFRSELLRNAKVTGDFVNDVERGAKVAAKGLAALGAASVAAGSIVGILTKAYADSGDQLAKLSDRTGQSVEKLSGLREMAKLSDVSVESMANGYKKLGIAAFEAAQGNAELRDLFGALNIQFKDTQGNVRPASALMLDLSDKIRMMSNESERGAVSQKLMGKGAAEMLPFLMQGSAAISAQAKEVEQLGVVWTTKAARAAETFNDNMTRTGIVLEGVRNVIGAAFLPVLNSLVERFLEWYKANKDLVQLKLQKWATDAADGVQKLVGVFGDLVDSFAKLAGGPLGETTKGVFQGLAAIFTLFSHALRETSAEIDVFFKKIGASSTMKKFWDDALVSGRKNLDAETKGKLERIFNPAPSGGGAGGGTPPPALTGGGPAAGGGLSITKNLEQNKKLSEELAQRATIEENLNNTVDRGLAGLKYKAELMNEQQYATEALKELLPQLNGHEANLLAIHNQEKALDVIGQEKQQQALAAERITSLERETALEQVHFGLQAEFYRAAPGAIGAAVLARAAGNDLINKQEETQLAVLAENRRQGVIVEAVYVNEVVRLHGEMEAKRMQLAREFPGFWEQQLTALAQSNSFSLGSIVSTWTGGIAQMIVKGGDLKAAWEATQIALVQAGLNSVVQFAAQQALKLVTAETTDAAKVASSAAADAAIVAGNTGAAAATTGVWAGATAAIVGFFGTITAAFAAMFATMVEVIVAVAEFVMGVLAAIAEALTATVFGIPWAGAIVLGIAAIVGALALSGAVKFANGGLVTGPTLGLVGEAGPEMIVPLDRVGEMFGGGAGTIIVPVQIDGREIARATVDHVPDALRRRGYL